jgi:hypothetical protein
MDERTLQGVGSEQPRASTEYGSRRAANVPEPLRDPRALTILTTEHWSLLSARSLVYNEAFARAGMFLTFLSATLVALGLVSAGTGFSRQFLFVVAVLLGVDLFIGLATLGRIMNASEDDLRYVGGMNRLRHAYHEMVPGLERYFITGRHDDALGVTSEYGGDYEVVSRPGIFHGFTTAPGMLGVICCVLAGALAGVVVLVWTGDQTAAAVVAVATFVLALVVATVVVIRRIESFLASLQPAFPHHDQVDGNR